MPQDGSEILSVIFVVGSLPAAWHSMKNGPTAENGKHWVKAHDPNWPKNGEKMRFGFMFPFFAILGPTFFPNCGQPALFCFSAVVFFQLLAFGPLYQAASQPQINSRHWKWLKSTMPTKSTTPHPFLFSGINFLLHHALCYTKNSPAKLLYYTTPPHLLSSRLDSGKTSSSQKKTQKLKRCLKQLNNELEYSVFANTSLINSK